MKSKVTGIPLLDPRLVGVGALLALLGAPGTTAAIQLFTEPFVPVDSYPTRVVLCSDQYELLAMSPALVEREGQTIKVLVNPGGCYTLCPPETVNLGVDLGLLPAGTYDLEIWRIRPFVPASPPELFETKTLTVQPGPRIGLVPDRPQAGDTVALRLNVVGRCPRVLPLETQGNHFELTLELDRCGGSVQPHELRVPLGTLPTGDYSVTVKSTAQFLAKTEFGVESPIPTLQNGRFEVEVTWENAAGVSGPGRLVQAPSRDSALFYFFSPNNWELMVKVLDGCAINGFYWVFAAASTDVAYHAVIREPGSGRSFELGNELGQAAPATTSITAFPCQ